MIKRLILAIRGVVFAAGKDGKFANPRDQVFEVEEKSFVPDPIFKIKDSSN